MKKVFIGIDFSKLKFDVAIYSVESKAIVSTEVFFSSGSLNFHRPYHYGVPILISGEIEFFN